MADPKDATFPLNRAAAYLKLNKCVPLFLSFILNPAAGYEPLWMFKAKFPDIGSGRFQDAERDCTKVLSLDTKNVKALFRRGQARARLGDYLNAKDGQF